MIPVFHRYVGIDYSGAETATAKLKGLSVYEADRLSVAREVKTPISADKFWTRQGIAEWLVAKLSAGPSTIVGIDHGFSFPLAYFENYALPHIWPIFLDDFQRHWPTDDAHTYVDFVREGIRGNGAARCGNSRWRRVAEIRTGGKSVFHFDAPGSVAKSTHAGIPWLKYLRDNSDDRIHFWPFDGWEAPTGKSVIVEVYPKLWSHSFPKEGRDSHQHDAFSVAEWLRSGDLSGNLERFLKPSLSVDDKRAAEIEGWILGVA